MIFEIVLHVSAIVAILAIVGSNRTKSAPRTREIEMTLDTLHAIGEALPDYDELFAEAEAIAPSPVSGSYFGSDRTTPEEAEAVDATSEAIAIHWESRATDNVVAFRRPSQHPALEGMSIRQLRQVVRDRGLQSWVREFTGTAYGSTPADKLRAAIQAV